MGRITIGVDCLNGKVQAKFVCQQANDFDIALALLHVRLIEKRLLDEVDKGKSKVVRK